MLSAFTLLPFLSYQVRFTLNDRTTLSDLMSLNLHKYEDEVRNIVDKSVKEMTMEKVLNGINEAWADMHFQHDIHQRTGVTLLKASDELIETLEDNQVSQQQLLFLLDGQLTPNLNSLI